LPLAASTRSRSATRAYSLAPANANRAAASFPTRDYVQERRGVPRGSVRAAVLIETLPAAFEMDEILYELREQARSDSQPTGQTCVEVDRHLLWSTCPLINSLGLKNARGLARRGRMGDRVGLLPAVLAGTRSSGFSGDQGTTRRWVNGPVPKVRRCLST
jgi:hypothetical protein